MVYGHWIWILNEDMASSLNSYATSAYRIMLHVKRTDKMTNEKIYEITKQLPLAQYVHQRQLSFIGHCLRRATSEPINMYALYTPQPSHGHRKQGYMAPSYADYIGRLLTSGAPPTASEIRTAAADRETWRALTRSTPIVVDCKPSGLASGNR
jgi:hypothetical protein